MDKDSPVKDVMELYNSGNQLVQFELFKLFWSRLSKSDMAPLQHFVHEYIVNNAVSGLFPFETFFDMFERNCFARGSVAVPIICYAFTSKYVDETKKMNLVNACDDLFRSYQVNKPSDLRADEFVGQIDQFIYFLRNVCVPEIMKTVLIRVDSARLQEIERIHVLENLIKIDAEHKDVYKEEIDKRYQQMAINYGVAQVNKGRIYANVTGMKAYLERELKDSYEAYLMANEQGIGDVLVRAKEHRHGKAVDVVSLDPKDIMDQMIVKIRDVFALNEAYGLDTYLSINIRHGMLDEKLRAPLAAYKLAVPYNDPRDKERIGEDWYKSAPAYKTTEITEAIYTFNEQVGAICDELLKNVVRISTEKRETKGGVFDLRLSEERFKRINARVWDANSLGEIIDTVIDFLWEETEKALVEMREVILPEKLTELNEAINGLLATFDNKRKYSSQIKDIKLMGDDFARSIDQIQDWFTHSREIELPEYVIEEVFLASLSVIKDLHPEKNIEVSKEYSDADGKHMTSRQTYVTYVTIFQNLLGNAVSYGKENNHKLCISYGLKCDDKGIEILIKNDIKYSQINNIERKMEEIKAKITDADYLDNVSSEGGSGIKKLCKMIATDLGYQPEFDFVLDKAEKTLGVLIKGIRIG